MVNGETAVVWTTDVDPTPTTPAVSVVGTSSGIQLDVSSYSPEKDWFYVIVSPTGPTTYDYFISYQQSTLVPYDSSATGFFAVYTAGFDETYSDYSPFEEDDEGPSIPVTFAAVNSVDGHLLTMDPDDASFLQPGFSHWEIERALPTYISYADDPTYHETYIDDLGDFSLINFPSLYEFGPDTYRAYRAKSVDVLGNGSAWSDWDAAFSGQSTIKDLFDNYGQYSNWIDIEFSELDNLYWYQLLDCSAAEPWDDRSPWGTLGTAYAINGDSATYVPADANGASALTYPRSPNIFLDFTADKRFTDDDYLAISTYGFSSKSATPGNGPFTAFLWDSNAGWVWFWGESALSAGWNHMVIKKRDMDEIIAGDWENIQEVRFGNYTGSMPDYVVSDVRFIKAHPDDPETPDETGGVWNFAEDVVGGSPGVWRIFPGSRAAEPDEPFGMGHIDVSNSNWKLAYRSLEKANVVAGTIQAGVFTHPSNVDKLAGLAFFVKDVTPDNWNMYAIELDNSIMRLVKWVDGVRTVISQVTTQFDANGQTIYIGADFGLYDADNGRIKVYAHTIKGSLIQADNLIISAQDTEWLNNAGGSVGLLAYDGNVRFVDFTAGSPAHADVADYAKLAANAIEVGKGRVRFNKDNDYIPEYTIDNGQTWTPIVSGGNTDTVYRPDLTTAELQIQSDGSIDLDGKEAFDGSDTWLRLNQASEFTNGIYTPGHFSSNSLRIGNHPTPGVGYAQFSAGTAINEFSIDGTLAGNSDNAVPTEKAVKTYVDAAGGGGSGTIKDMGYDEFYGHTTAISTTNPTWTTVTGASVTFTSGGGDIIVIATVSYYNQHTINAGWRVYLDSTTTNSRVGQRYNATTDDQTGVICRTVKFTGVSAASHTIYLQVTKVGGSGNFYTCDNVNRPGSLQVFEILS